ncbi:TPA: hypothetical protein I8608_000329 [Morganella morganii]|jgi:hypothetical protein|uniref:Uncharacterized protein n=1 Tax=Morganella morganii TaxID=582 RepID=A0AAN5MDX5_MORMO|nr:hypothetical protein [Morganella morganii]HED3889077.1 hypothetical protein [Morganella morganii]
MKRVTLILLAVAISASASASNRSLDDFFKKNPELQKNTAIRAAIISQAEEAAIEDESVTAPKNIKRRVWDNGYAYAVSAMMDLRIFCEDNIFDMYLLTIEDCDIIQQYEEN